MIGVSAELLQPMSAARRREAAFHTPAWEFVPGWVLRGALAATWIREFGVPAQSSRRAEFVELFEGAICYGPLVPEGSAFEPLSVLACKYRPQPECASWFRDLAADGVGTADVPALPEAAGCGICGRPTLALRGRLLGGATTSRRRTQLDDDGTAADGQLFMRDEVARATRLVGAVDGDHEWLRELCGKTVWFGGRRSTAGRARLTLVQPPQPPVPEPRSDGSVVVRCRTPLIAVDELTRPLLEPDVGEIAAVLGVERTSLRLRHAWQRPDTIGGWHAASGLPKPEETVVVAGSTFIYDVVGLAGGVGSAALAALASSALGLRTREGFGQIEVNPPPWSPSATSKSSADLADAGRAVDSELVEAIKQLTNVRDMSTRNWMRDRLRKVAESLETGRPRDVSIGRSGFDLNDAVRNALVRVLEDGDLSMLRGLADRLREERG